MLSVVVLTKDSEDTLGKCLTSVKDLNSELVVLDSGSKDKTEEIAESFDAKFISKRFIDFSTQRNFGIDKTSGDWILYVDSDEELTEKFKEELLKKISQNSDLGGYFIKRKTYFFGKNWGLTDKVQRLFLRSNFIEWNGIVHETPKIKGEFGIINNPINHYTHRELSQMVEKTNEWSNYEAALRFKSGHPRMTSWRFFRVITTAFFSSYFREKGYKNGTYGIVESIYQSFSMFITYAKLWEKQSRVN